MTRPERILVAAYLNLEHIGHEVGDAVGATFI
jgi:hypothetical protein